MQHDSSLPIVVPFLKWAGGKRWLINQYPDLFPPKYNRYIEPFVGSGAVFFCLAPSKAILSDLNPALIDTYKALKKDWNVIHSYLEKYQKLHSKDFYYKMRKSVPANPAERAARFIYLNRTCWNGLYRVNMRGEFNVPVGTKTAVILKTDNFEEISKSLKGTKLRCCDFEKTLEEAEKGDFVFIDPPYTINHNLNGFIKYNENLFNWDDQLRLRDAIKKAKKRGAKVLVTNADHESVRKLYSGLGHNISLERASVISGLPSGRGRYSELIIRLWDD